MADPRIARAKAAGYSDQEIADYLAGSGRPEIAQARQAGYSDAEIIQYLSGVRPPPARPEERASFGEGLRDLGESFVSGLQNLRTIPGNINRINEGLYGLAQGVPVIGDIVEAQRAGYERLYSGVSPGVTQYFEGQRKAGEAGAQRARERQSEQRQYRAATAPWYAPDNLLNMGVESLPSMIVPIGGAVAGRALGFSGRAAAGIGAALEGTQAAAGVNQGIVQSLLDRGYSEEEAIRAAALPSLAAGGGTAGLGRVFSRFEAGLLDGVLPDGALAGAARGAASEGVEEAAQSGQEQFFQNVGVYTLDRTQGLLDGVGQAALQGGALGGIMGGGIGAVAGAGVRNENARGAARQQLIEDITEETAQNVELSRRAQEIRNQRAAAAAQAGAQETTSISGLLPDRSGFAVTTPGLPQDARDRVDQVQWRESVAPIFDEMARGNYESLLADREENPNLPKPVRPEPDPIGAQAIRDPFTPEMGAELIRSAEAGPLTPSLLREKGIPRPKDTLSILERRGFLRQTGIQETKTQTKSGKTRTVKEPVYESTAIKPPEQPGPGQAVEFEVRPVPTAPATQRNEEASVAQARQAREQRARDRASDARRELAALPQVNDDTTAERAEALSIRRRTLEAQLAEAELEVARSRTGRADFAVIQKIRDPSGSVREQPLQTFPTRQAAESWLDAKMKADSGLPAVSSDRVAQSKSGQTAAQTKQQRETAARNARLASDLNSVLKSKIGDRARLVIESELGQDFGDGQIVDPEGFEEGASDPETGAMRSVIALARDVHDPSLTEDQLRDRLAAVLSHEIIHSLRTLGLYTPQEWNVLSKAVRTMKVSGTEYTFLQRAFERYKDVYLRADGTPNMDMIVEEAVADFARVWNEAGGKIRERHTGLLNRIYQFFSRIFKRLSASDVMRRIDSGEFAGRDVGSGVSRPNPEENVSGPPLSDGNRRFMFSGRKSQTLPEANYALAKEMKSNGEDRGKIYFHTGVWWGRDGFPRYEIPDDAATFTRAAASNGDSFLTRIADRSVPLDWENTTRLRDAIDHVELFAAYPTLANTRLVVDESIGSGAYFSTAKNYIAVGPEVFATTENPLNGREMAPGEYFKSLVLHEAQHFIQLIEGFAYGTSQRSVESTYFFDRESPLAQDFIRGMRRKERQLADTAKSMHLFDWAKLHHINNLDVDIVHAYTKMRDGGRLNEEEQRRIKPLLFYAAYTYSEGEIEARNVQERAEMSPAQRSRIAPWRTQDVEERAGIVFFLRDGGVIHGSNLKQWEERAGRIDDGHQPDFDALGALYSLRKNVEAGATTEEVLERIRDLIRDGNSSPAPDADPALAELKRQRTSYLEGVSLPAMQSIASTVGLAPPTNGSGRRYSVFGGRIYSALDRAIKNSNTKKATGKQWLATLLQSPGISREELSWTMMDSYLEFNDEDMLTKEQVAEEFEKYQVYLEEHFYGPHALTEQEMEEFDREVEFLMSSEGMTRGEAEDVVLMELDQTSGEEGAGDYPRVKTRFPQYAIQGGRNYSELLITMPTSKRGSSVDEMYGVNHRAPGGPLSGQDYGFLSEAHFNDPQDENLIVHMRFSTFMDDAGRKTMTIHEIQSDIHQRGRIAGYRPEQSEDAIERAEKSLAKKELEADEAKRNLEEVRSQMLKAPANKRDSMYSVVDGLQERLDIARAGREEARNALTTAREAVENDDYYDAPFKNNAWVKLAIKRAILHAMDTGHDRIAWENGDVMRNRWKSDGVAYFYDNVVPKLVGEVVKSYGASIDYSVLKDADNNDVMFAGEPLRVSGFNITGQMHNAVIGKGFRMFSLAGARPRASALPAGGQYGGAGTESGSLIAAARYTVVQDYLSRGARFNPWMTQEDVQRGVDRLTTKLVDRSFPIRRMVSDVLALGGTLTDNSDPVLAEVLYPRRAQHRLEKAHANLYRPAFVAMQQIGGTQTDLASLAKVSEAAKLELEASQVSPSHSLLNMYMYARHAKERNAFVRDVRQTPAIDPETGERTGEVLGNGSGMSDSEADAILQWFSRYKNGTKVQMAADKVDAILAYTRRIRVESGLSPDWEAVESDLVPRFAHYVPLRGEAAGLIKEEWLDEEQHLRTGKRFGIKGREDPRMKGRSSYAGDVLANVLMQNQESLVRAEKAKVGQALVNFVRRNRDVARNVIEEIPALPRHLVVDGRTGKARYVPNTGALDNSSEYFVTKVGGNEVYFKVHDEGLARALNSIPGARDEVTQAWMRVMGRGTRLLSRLMTSYNPEFFVPNFLRDVQTAMIQSGQYDDAAWKYIGRMAPAYAVRGLKMASTGQPDADLQAKIDRLSELGGLTGVYGLTTISDQINEINREISEIESVDKKGAQRALDLSRKAIATGFQYLEDINDTVENATRLAVYEAFKAKGLSDERAAQMAKDMTVNFNRKGEIGPFLNAGYMFFNAAVQGTSTMVQAIFSKRGGQVVMALMAAGLMQELLMSALSEEDDQGNKEYDKIEDYILEKNMVLMLPDGQYLKIPLPLGYNIFHSAGRHIARVFMGKEGAMEAGIGMANATRDAFNPFGSSGSWLVTAMPSLIKPAAETALNKDFTGQAIRPEGMPGLDRPASQEFFPGATTLSQGVAEGISRITGGDGAYTPGLIEISPDNLDHIFASYTGGLGRFAGRLVNLAGFAVDPQGKEISGDEIRVRDIPFYRSFAGNVSDASIRGAYDNAITPYLRVGKSADEFERLGEFAALDALEQRDGQRLAIYDVMADFERDRIRLRRELREVQNDYTLSDSQKAALARQIRDEEQAIMNEAIRTLRQMERAAGLD